jgi:hypothetical protein
MFILVRCTKGHQQLLRYMLYVFFYVINRTIQAKYRLLDILEDSHKSFEAKTMVFLNCYGPSFPSGRLHVVLSIKKLHIA